jgi:hypothetical protein
MVLGDLSRGRPGRAAGHRVRECPLPSIMWEHQRRHRSQEQAVSVYSLQLLRLTGGATATNYGVLALGQA